MLTCSSFRLARKILPLLPSPVTPNLRSQACDHEKNICKSHRVFSPLELFFWKLQDKTQTQNMGIKDPLLTLPCSSEAPMVPSHGYPSFPSLVMIFPAAELRQINLQCLDATQIPSGSRKSINRTAEGKRTSSKFWM